MVGDTGLNLPWSRFDGRSVTNGKIMESIREKKRVVRPRGGLPSPELRARQTGLDWWRRRVAELQEILDR